MSKLEQLKEKAKSLEAKDPKESRRDLARRAQRSGIEGEAKP